MPNAIVATTTTVQCVYDIAFTFVSPTDPATMIRVQDYRIMDEGPPVEAFLPAPEGHNRTRVPAAMQGILFDVRMIEWPRFESVYDLTKPEVFFEAMPASLHQRYTPLVSTPPAPTTIDELPLLYPTDCLHVPPNAGPNAAQFWWY